MLKYADYDIVFQEVPGEVTLAINLSLCPNGCPGCHSAYLMGDAGEPLDEAALWRLLDKYGCGITCVCFMGGDNDPAALTALARAAKRRGGWKIGWYSGKPDLPDGFPLDALDYLKLGPYVSRLGGLDSPTTNQRMYKIVDGKTLKDITAVFRRG